MFRNPVDRKYAQNRYRNRIVTSKERIDNVMKSSEFESPVVINDHPSAEYYILSMGKFFGFHLAFAHPSHKFQTRRLKDHFSLKDISKSLDENLKQIDITFFGDDNQPKLCFEVIHTKRTNINALHRYVNLKDTDTKLFIVSKSQKDFKREIKSKAYDSIRDRTSFVSYANLAKLCSTLFGKFIR
jgi:hypothetical protein